MPTDDMLDAYLVEMMRIVDQRGWGIQGVFPRADDPEPGPHFSYTVGLSAKGLPEILVYGFPARIAVGVLNDVAERFVKGQPLPVRQKVDEILVDYPVMLIPCKTDDIGVARKLYGADIQALQLVWPDASGTFPWEEGYDPKLIKAQPVYEL